MKNNKYLHELQRSLQITDDCFCEALMLIAEIPQYLHEEAINSCKHYLSLLEHHFEQFKREVLQINQFGQKIGEEDCNG